eukprot:922352-Amphidinium_carterae.1
MSPYLCAERATCSDSTTRLRCKQAPSTTTTSMLSFRAIATNSKQQCPHSQISYLASCGCSKASSDIVPHKVDLHVSSLRSATGCYKVILSAHIICGGLG